ncbi:MAG: caspase family protein [Paludibacteraceae bacterium]|nr:caspase family protein [Paludibacteraceae bacterium]
MKRLLTILLLTLVTSLTFAEKRALVIGIGTYAPDTGWDAINGDNDIALAQEMLQANGFLPKHIAILKNEQATYRNIRNALTALVNTSASGDVVYIHFSGHGQQITDMNDDEADGYDEAWVPYDAPIQPSDTYHGERHLTDDELNHYLTLLWQKVGVKGKITVISDACHSGTGTRKWGETNIRGTSAKFLLTDSSKEQYAPGQEHWLHISACKDGECNRQYVLDGKAYGSLSYTLYLLRDQLQSTSATDLINSINAKINELVSRPQTPQLEGSEICKQATIL